MWRCSRLTLSRSSVSTRVAAEFEALRRERDKTDAALDAWAHSLTPEALAGTIRIVRKGAQQELPLWWIVGQVFNHQTHHRGQVTTLLFQAGQDPGVTDLFAMLIEEAQL